MHFIPTACLAVTLAVVSACGTHDTELAVSQEPANGVACSSVGEERGPCQCAEDGSWLCAGQGSVTCSSLFGSGGGALLVNRDMECEMIWGWQQSCSDGRSYGVDCNGLFCSCSVNEVPTGRTFLTPRCAEMAEANGRCGWSLAFPAGVSAGSGPMQGMPCSPLGGHDGATGCECTPLGWDCQRAGDCLLSKEWSDTTSPGPRLSLFATGTFDYALEPGVRRDDILSGAAPGFSGTWQLEGDFLFVRSAHAPPEPACDDNFGAYRVRFEPGCGALALALESDPCAARSAVLATFSGARP